MNYLKIPQRAVGAVMGNANKTYLRLLWLANVKGSDSVIVKLDTLARETKLNTINVFDHIVKLEKAGLVEKKARRGTFTGLKIACEYVIKRVEGEQYFLFPDEYANLEVAGSGVLLLMALYMFSYNSPHCYPSITQLNVATRMSRGTITKYTRVLEDMGVITKQNYIKRGGDFGHNRYFLSLPIEKIMGTQLAESLRRSMRRAKSVTFETWHLICDVIAGKAQFTELAFPDGAVGGSVSFEPSCPFTYSEPVEPLSEANEQSRAELPQKRGIIGKIIHKIGAVVRGFFERRAKKRSL